MKALFFGSVGTLVETSELQRAAYNRAFRDYGLDWEWDADYYHSLLTSSGGLARIRHIAEERGESVDALAIHDAKTRLFQHWLQEKPQPLRHGVSETLKLAKAYDLSTAFVSTTDIRTINLIRELVDDIALTKFDVVTSANNQFAQKPEPEAYEYVLRRLQLKPDEAIAIEDNAPGVQAAKQLGCFVIAYPGDNTQQHDYSQADVVVADNLAAVVSDLLV
jgi:HAD superfamily hydrolase (TIGR01509 family)